MNKVILVGRLTKDPEIRYTQSGIAVATFTLAVDRKYVKKDEGKQTADYIPIVCWRKTAEVVGNNLVKGRRVGIEGAMQVRTYDAQDGSKRWITEVVADEVEFLDSRQESQGAAQHTGSSQTGTFPPANAQEIADEEIPF